MIGLVAVVVRVVVVVSRLFIAGMNRFRPGRSLWLPVCRDMRVFYRGIPVLIFRDGHNTYPINRRPVSRYPQEPCPAPPFPPEPAPLQRALPRPALPPVPSRLLSWSFVQRPVLRV